MNRLGKTLVGLFLLLAIAFAALVRCVPAGEGGPAAVSPGERAESRPGETVEPESPVVTGPDGLAVPVEGVSPGALRDTFAEDRGDGDHMHGALDILAPLGTPVVAAAAGRLEKIFESEAGGHTVYIRSADGRWIYYYAHLDAYAPGLAEGQLIARGQRIGTVGSTGNADPAAPHLHFEVKAMAASEKWHEGRGINPYPLLGGR